MSSKARRAVLAQRLVSARKDKGLSQTELADAVGVTRQSISGWEGGRSAPREAVLVKLALALGLPERTFSSILATDAPAASADEEITVAEAAERDPHLTDDQRSNIKALYADMRRLNDLR